MKPRTSTVCIGVAIVMGFVAVLSEWIRAALAIGVAVERDVVAMVDGSAIAAAVHAYVQEQAARGQSLSASISINELMRAGYLKPNDIAPFEGMEVRINLSTNDPGLMAWAKMPGESAIVVLGDGSVQSVTGARLREQLRLNERVHERIFGEPRAP